jgi:hypothetical protein
VARTIFASAHPEAKIREGVLRARDCATNRGTAHGVSLDILSNISPRFLSRSTLFFLYL